MLILINIKQVKFHFENKEIINYSKKKFMFKNKWREEARQLIYKAIAIKGYKLKHLSAKYTDGDFAIICSYTFKLNVVMVDHGFYEY